MDLFQQVYNFDIFIESINNEEIQSDYKIMSISKKNIKIKSPKCPIDFNYYDYPLLYSVSINFNSFEEFKDVPKHIINFKDCILSFEINDLLNDNNIYRLIALTSKDGNFYHVLGII